MQACILIAELQRPCGKGEVRGDGASKSFRVSHDCLEVFDADYHVHVLLHVEVFEIFRVDGDGCFKRLLQYFYVESAFHCIKSLNNHTFAVLDLLCEARENRLCLRRQKIELFSLWAKVVDVLSEYSS